MRSCKKYFTAKRSDGILQRESVQRPFKISEKLRVKVRFAKNRLFGCFLKNEYQNQKSYPQFMIKMRITFCKFFNSNAQRARGGGGLQLYKLIFLAAEPQLRCGINRVCAVAAFNALKQMIPAGVVGGINKVKTCAVDCDRVK